MFYRIKANLCNWSLTIATLLLLAGTSSAQIDLFPRFIVPKQIDTCSYIVDAANTPRWAGADGGAWINAADAALTSSCGTNLPGIIYVHGNVNATTQITVGVRHTLDLQGAALQVSNPILMSDGANIDCHQSRGSPGNVSVNACLVATANMNQLIRGLTQDGTTEMFSVQRFQIDGGFNNFSLGAIDLTGMNDRTVVRDGEMIHFGGAGACIYISNAPTNSTSFQRIENIWCIPGGNSGTPNCIQIVTQGTNTGSIGGIHFDDFECAGGSATRAILVQNSTIAADNAINDIYFDRTSLNITSATSGIYIDRAWNILMYGTTCTAGTITNCIDVSSNTHNVGISADRTIAGFGGGTVTNLINDGLNTITSPVAGGHTNVPHYEFFNSASSVAGLPAYISGPLGFQPKSSHATPIPSTVVQCEEDSTQPALMCNYGNDAFKKVVRVNGTPTAGHLATWFNISDVQDGAFGPIQQKRVSGCATAASLNATCDTTVTWTTAFADANYTAVCTGDVVTSGVPIIQGIDISAAKIGASITVRTISITAAAAQFTTIDCSAVHD